MQRFKFLEAISAVNMDRAYVRMRKLGAAALFLLAITAISRGSNPALRFWAVSGSPDDVAMYDRLAADFERKTHVKVNVTSLPWGNFSFKYFTSMAAGLPPDIGITNLGGPFDYGSVGGLVDLRAEFPEESAKLAARFNPNLLKMFTVDGRLYGLPNDATTLLLYYRTDLFERLGLQAPKTWSELDATIAALEGKGYQYYFGFTNGAQWAVPMLFTMAFGYPGVHLDAAGNPEVDWQQPKYQKAVLEALNLWYMHDSPGKDLGGRALGLFAANEPGRAVPLMLDLPAVAEQLHITQPGLDGKWAIAPWPKADNGVRQNVYGGTCYVIFRESKMKHEAFKWLQFLNTVDSQRKIVLDHLGRGENADFIVPTLRDIWEPENDSFWARPELARSTILHQALAEALPSLHGLEGVHGSTETSRLEANLLDSMGSFIQDQLTSTATRLGVSRSQLIQGFGRGEWQAEHARIESAIANRLAAGYKAIARQAETILKEQTRKYRTGFGDALQSLPIKRHSLDALTVAKFVAGTIVLVGAGAAIGIGRFRKHLVSYTFVAVPLALALVFVFVPAAVALYLSFTQYHPVLPLSTAKWVGIQNYAEIVKSGDLMASLGRTFYYTVITVPIGILISLVFAYLLNAKLRAQRLWRFVYFAPLVTTVVSVALIFSQLFLSAKQGWMNGLLLRLGLLKDPIPFLTSERSFLNCVIALATWQGLAFTILVFLAGLQQIPSEQFEAADVDGAGAVRKFWKIAVPGIRPQVFFVAVLGAIGGMQVFETIYTLANKSGDAGARFGPNDSGLTVVPLLYHYGFETFEMGKASAVAYVLFVLILLITAFQMRVFRRGDA